jgi:hypothetical protein
MGNDELAWDENTNKSALYQFLQKILLGGDRS